MRIGRSTLPLSLATITLAAPLLAVLIRPGLQMTVTAEERDVPHADDSIEAIWSDWLPNAHRVLPNVLVGGQPEGDAGFEALHTLGVRTVISVDGARPDTLAADRYGIRYVHLPHGYDGISETRKRQLAVAIRRLPKPIYIHCHHGRHRSPAAAAAGCITAGLLSADAGTEILNRMGTSPDYRGLFRAVASASPAEGLESVQFAFQESMQVPPLAATMVEIERYFDQLAELEEAGWRAPPTHPDLSARHSSLLLWEQFNELLRTEETSRRPDGYQAMLRHSLQLAETLKNELSGSESLITAADRERYSTTLSMIKQDCKRCHRSYRD